jgi:hypothetical protein
MWNLVLPSTATSRKRHRTTVSTPSEGFSGRAQAACATSALARRCPAVSALVDSPARMSLLTQCTDMFTCSAAHNKQLVRFDVQEKVYNSSRVMRLVGESKCSRKVRLGRER